jgi:hypothetical protein
VTTVVAFGVGIAFVGWAIVLVGVARGMYAWLDRDTVRVEGEGKA